MWEQATARLDAARSRLVKGEIGSENPDLVAAVDHETSLRAALERGERIREANGVTAQSVRAAQAVRAERSPKTQPTADGRLRLGADVAVIIARVRDGGGYTVNPLTGTEPASGYCINEVGECPKVDAEEFFDPQGGRRAIEAFIAEHREWFAAPVGAGSGSPSGSGKHVGIWHDKANSKVVLDRVDVVADLDAALELGRARNQRSMWDVAGQREISLR